jgi:hypothetical protein
MINSMLGRLRKEKAAPDEIMPNLGTCIGDLQRCAEDDVAEVESG